MKYRKEHLSDDEDDGTMPDNVATLEDAVVGHCIVSAEKVNGATYIKLDNGSIVELHDTDDCCAFTSLESFLLHPERIEHMILGVGTTESYTVWHIYADLGDVMDMQVGWSPGNPFYYGYGFDIHVKPAEVTPESLAEAKRLLLESYKDL